MSFMNSLLIITKVKLSTIKIVMRTPRIEYVVLFIASTLKSSKLVAKTTWKVTQSSITLLSNNTSKR
jgi:hypothetical protein